MASATVREAIERWRGEHMPSTMLNGKVAPTTVEEARNLRAEAIVEQKDLEARAARAHGYDREMLRRKITETQAHIAEINVWITKARIMSPMRAVVPLATPMLAPEVAAPLLVGAPEFPNRCACGEEVRPERARDAWIFYCQRCGNDWTAPAPREPVKPTPRKAIKRCTCGRRCGFCGGEKRR